MVADLSDGACAGKANSSYAISDPFYPDNSERRKNSKPVDYREAKEICDRCTIRDKCLRDALSEEVQWGYRAGTTAEERQQLKAKAQRPPGRPINRFNPTPQDLELRVTLHAQGLTDAQIGKQLGLASNTITTWRRHNGMPTNGTPHRPHTIEQQIIKQRAYDAGCTDAEIAEQAGCRVNAIRKWRMRLGLPVNPVRQKVPA